ncbi:hypothetical protein [Terrabacter terrigena]|uniref:Uncharacterized protein n=1 Tax=Terrabacter terrigena TaxID=574718 RepID=A0ABW3MXI0_9MICO
MALALDASAPAAVTIAAAGQPTTASFTPPSGSLLVVLYSAGDTLGGTDESITSITNTGTAITWTRRVRKNRNAASDGGASTVDGGAEIWTGVGNGTAITVTVNGVSGDVRLMKVMVLTGADTSSLANTAALAAANSTPSLTVPSCLVGSYVFAASSDQRNRGAGTAGTGQTIIAEQASATTNHQWRTTNTLASAGSQTMNLTAPTGQDYDLVALEVRAGAASSAPPQRGQVRTFAVTRASTY